MSKVGRDSMSIVADSRTVKSSRINSSRSWSLWCSWSSRERVRNECLRVHGENPEQIPTASNELHILESDQEKFEINTSKELLRSRTRLACWIWKVEVFGMLYLEEGALLLRYMCRPSFVPSICSIITGSFACDAWRNWYGGSKSLDQEEYNSNL
jgi:hypothetical protein